MIYLIGFETRFCMMKLSTKQPVETIQRFLGAFQGFSESHRFWWSISKVCRISPFDLFVGQMPMLAASFAAENIPSFWPEIHPLQILRFPPVSTKAAGSTAGDGVEGRSGALPTPGPMPDPHRRLTPALRCPGCPVYGCHGGFPGASGVPQ